MPWTAPTPAPADGPVTGDDREILEGYLRWQRETLLNICAGLDAGQLAQRPLPPSELSLLGLVRHLAKVERIWLRQRAAGESVESLFGGPGAPDDFRDVAADGAERALEALQQEWRLADEAVAGMSFDDAVAFRDQTWSLRMVYVHLIGEYARHNGHADLLREQLDGVTGR
ncbi:MAG: DinB family protein [Blastococcus sp.]